MMVRTPDCAVAVYASDAKTRTINNRRRRRILGGTCDARTTLSLTEPLAVLTGDDECLYHFGVNKVAIELVQLC